MRTRSSPTNSSEDVNVQIVAEPVADKRCDWNRMDEINLLNFLMEHRGEQGDGDSFKTSVWTAAALELEKSRIKGGPKTSKACSDKWNRVRRICFWI